MQTAVEVCPDHPVLIDKFLEDAIEIDVMPSRTERRWSSAASEHIEEAGIHSGDSACVLPCISLAEELIQEIAEIKGLGPGA